jgi:hypothetical protein
MQAMSRFVAPSFNRPACLAAHLNLKVNRTGARQ